MNLNSFLALVTLCVVVKGAWLAAAVQPVILGLGAVFTALNLDVLDGVVIELMNRLPLEKKRFP